MVDCPISDGLQFGGEIDGHTDTTRKTCRATGGPVACADNPANDDKTRTIRTIISLAAMMPIAAAADGLAQATQTIFGMDCAPCAHGIEKGLSKLAGVESVGPRYRLRTGDITLEKALKSRDGTEVELTGNVPADNSAELVVTAIGN